MLSRITHFHLKTNFFSSRSHSRQCRKRDSVPLTKHKTKLFETTQLILARRDFFVEMILMSLRRQGGAYFNPKLSESIAFLLKRKICWKFTVEAHRTFSGFAGWRGLNRKIETATVSYAPASKSASHGQWFIAGDNNWPKDRCRGIFDTSRWIEARPLCNRPISIRHQHCSLLGLGWIWAEQKHIAFQSAFTFSENRNRSFDKKKERGLRALKGLHYKRYKIAFLCNCK